MYELSVKEWLELASHVKKWVVNLSRAKEQRKQDSKEAIRSVIRAIRKTTIYIRGLEEGEGQSLSREGELSLLWTELSFKLADLGLTKLAERCDLAGRYWANPRAIIAQQMSVAELRLDDVEHLAIKLLEEIK